MAHFYVSSYKLTRLLDNHETLDLQLVISRPARKSPGSDGWARFEPEGDSDWASSMCQRPGVMTWPLRVSIPSILFKNGTLS